MSLARRIVKGSTEALAWGKKMREIRRAGKKTERAFFGPRGVFAKAEHAKHVKNPIEPHPDFTITEHPVHGGGKSYGILWYIDGVHSVGFSTAQEAYNNAVRHVHRHPGKYGKGNPGEAWHEGMQHVAARYGRDAGTREEKILFKGVEVAHRDSAKAARRMKMNPKRRPSLAKHRTVRPGEGRFPMSAVFSGKEKPVKKNPLAVFTLGNPPTRINTGIAGIVYNICHEIRAEKTGFKKGLYRHPFSRKSGVQILALDNGDLLIHSTAKVRLWKLS